MLYQFACPDCGVELKTPQPIPDGRSIQCPKCSRVFTTADTTVRTIPSPGLFDEPANQTPTDDTKESSGFPPLRRRPQNDAPTEPTARRRRPDDDADDDRSRSRRRYEDEEEDRPRRRNRPIDDEGDDRPRRRPENEEYDDRPRRRRRYEEDEDDDRPRRRYNRPRRSALSVFLICGTVVGVIGTILFLIGYFMQEPDELRPPPVPLTDIELLSYCPPNAKVVFGLQPDEVAKNPALVKVIEDAMREEADGNLAIDGLKKFQAAAGIEMKDMSHLFMAMRSLDQNDGYSVAVIRFHKDVDVEQFTKGTQSEKVVRDGREFYKTPMLEGLYCFPTKNCYVWAGTEDLLQDVLRQKRTVSGIPAALKSIVAESNTGHYWVAGERKALQDVVPFKDTDGPKEIKDMVQDVRALGVSFTIIGPKVQMGVNLACSSESKANKAAVVMRQGFRSAERRGVEKDPDFKNMPFDQQLIIREMVGNTWFQNRVEVFTMNTTIPWGIFEKLVKDGNDRAKNPFGKGQRIGK